MFSNTLEIPSNRHRLHEIPGYWAKPKNRRKYATRIERLLTRVIGYRFYIVFDSELPFRMNHDLLGAYHPQFPKHHAIQHAIGARFERDCLVILFNNQGHGRYPEWEPAELLHVAVHEAAHAINEAVIPFEQPLSPAGANEIVVQVTEPHASWKTPGHEELHHDWRFVRSLFHIANRVKSAGWSVSIHKLCDWNSHGYSDPVRFRELLADDFKQRGPLREVLKTQAPSSFLDHWCSLLASRSTQTIHF